MSNEDDEVLLEGNPLYNYMEELGFSQLDEISVARPSGAPPATRELQSSGFVGTVFVSGHVRRLLELIFNSHLVFDDDFNFISSCVPEATVQPNRYRYGCIAVSVAAALNAGIILLDKRTVSSFLGSLSIIPSFIITLGSAGYVSKLIFDNYKEQREEKDLTNHIKVLQMFYKLLQRIIGDIRDIDMLTRGYGLKNQNSGDDHKLFVPLIKFRIAIATALIEIGKRMSSGFINLKELVPEIVKQTDFALISTRDLLPDYITFDETKMSVNDLNNLNRTYQLVQSEYLRWLALCYCTVQPKNERLAKKVCVKVVELVHSIVLKYYSELNFQYVVTLYGRRSYGRSIEKQKITGNGHVDILTDSVHNVVIHLVSLMEEAKKIESSLHISSSLVYEGRQSAEDLLKFFTVKFNEFKIKLQNINDHILKMDRDLKKQMTTISSASMIETKNEKYTKEHLSGTSVGAFELTGKSDFSVRGEHEVFIGTSCNDTNMVTDTDEEYVFERRQLMPNVLSELKTALRPVYEMHAERERQALLRTGKSYLETVAEEEFSNNTSECSSGIKDIDEINSPRPISMEGAEAVLDNPCSNLVALCSTYMPAETGRNISVSRYDTSNSSISTSTGFPDSMNISGSFSCVTGISSEPYHCTEVAGDTINNSQHNLRASNNVNTSAGVGTSTMFSTNKAYVPDSVISASVIDTNVTEFNTVVATESSCLPKSLTKDITEQKLIADSLPCAVAGSSKSTNYFSHSATIHTASVCPPISEDYAASSKPNMTSSTDISVDDISQRNEIHETLLSGMGNLRMLSKQKTLIEEQFIYDGDSDTELSG